LTSKGRKSDRLKLGKKKLIIPGVSKGKVVKKKKRTRE